MANTPTVVDLFCGAGGMSVGFSAADFRLVGAVESIPTFAATHQANFEHCSTVCEDLSEFEPNDFASKLGIRPGEVDLVVGGPPCQPFSNIGTPKIKSLRGHKAHSDTRKYLFEPFLQYVEYLAPRGVLIENVPQLRTKDRGALFQRILRRLGELGYRTSWAVLNAVEHGVPQARRRVFIAGTRQREFSFPKATHASDDAALLPLLADDGLRAPVTVRQALDDLPKISDGCRADLLPYSKADGLSDYQISLRSDKGLVGNNTCRISNDRAKQVFQHMKPGTKYMDLPADVRRILPFREDIFHDRLKRLHPDRPSWTVLAHIGMDGYMYIHPWEDRTLSVREAARIQSFPDDFRFIGNMREQYVQVGNAVPPRLAQRIADQFRIFLNDKRAQYEEAGVC